MLRQKDGRYEGELGIHLGVGSRSLTPHKIPTTPHPTRTDAVERQLLGVHERCPMISRGSTVLGVPTNAKVRVKTVTPTILKPNLPSKKSGILIAPSTNIPRYVSTLRWVGKHKS